MSRLLPALTKISSKSCKNTVERVKPVLKKGGGDIFSICCKCKSFSHYWCHQYCATSRKVAGSILDGHMGFFFIFSSFRPQYGPGVDSVSDINGYQDDFLDGQGSRCIGLTTLPPSYADCLEIQEAHTLGTLGVSPGLYRDCFTRHLRKREIKIK